MANEILPVSESKLRVPPDHIVNGALIDDFYVQWEGLDLYDAGNYMCIITPDLTQIYIFFAEPDTGIAGEEPDIGIIGYRYYFGTNSLLLTYIRNLGETWDEARRSPTTTNNCVYVAVTSSPSNGGTAYDLTLDNMPCDGTWILQTSESFFAELRNFKIKIGPYTLVTNVPDPDGSQLGGLIIPSQFIWNVHKAQAGQVIAPTVLTTAYYEDAAQNTRHYSDAQTIRSMILPKQPSRSVVGGVMAQEYAKVPDSGYYVEFYNAETLALGTTITFIAPNGDAISCVRTGTTNVDLRDQRFLLDGTFVQQRSPKNWECTSTITANTPIDGTWQIIIIVVGLYFPNDETPPTINLGNYGRYRLNNVRYTKPNSLYHIWNAHEGSYDETIDLTATDVTRMATGPAQVNAANFRFYDSYGATAAELPNVMDLIASITAPDAPEAPTAPDAPSTDRPPVLVFDPDYSETVKSGIFSKGAA